MNKVILFFLFVSINTFSQGLFNSYEIGTIYLRNNSKLEGYIKKTKFDKIKYKKNLKAKKQVFDYETVNKIVFTKDKKTYYYKYNGVNTYLLEKKIDGKVKLYIHYEYTGSTMGANGMMMGGGSYAVYYIEKNNPNKVEELLDVMDDRFWSYFSKYVADCNDFIDKVKDKKSTKKNFKNKKTRIFDMITYYNSHCK
jgi:hypothetical protein